MADRVDDDEYLGALIPAVQKALDEFSRRYFVTRRVDPYCEDQLGGLSLTKEGLKQRDGSVFEEARRRKIPVATTLAGGYARRWKTRFEFTSIRSWPLGRWPKKYPQVSSRSA